MPKKLLKDSAKVMHSIVGGPLTGFVVHNPDGEPVSEKIENMWDAIALRDSLDRKDS